MLTSAIELQSQVHVSPRVTIFLILCFGSVTRCGVTPVYWWTCLSLLLPFFRSQVFTASNYCPIVSAGSEVRSRPGETVVVVVAVAVVIRLFPGKQMILGEWRNEEKTCD